ncbi:hypothetical protein ACWV26_06830 [Rummeliibacillus sp. JY-2-4R]
MNTRYFVSLITAILFIILVFMNYIGYWNADSTVQIIFFFAMIASIFNIGNENGKRKG